jgi:fumarate hydratase subunit beta
MTKILTPVDTASITSLKAGEQLFLSGKLYTARDAAHKRLIALLDEGKKLPVDFSGQFLYYTGPSPARPGGIIGSAGPTTSYRMDRYTPQLLAESGLRGIIGKGGRGLEVAEALKKNKCIYCAATGGAGALLGACITSARIVCYEDLGPEAIRELTVENLPLIVAIDIHGGNMYLEGPARFSHE